MSSGSTCSVVGCYNNTKKLKMLLETTCVLHQIRRYECPCPVAYMHSMPRNEERKRAWLAALRLKRPPKRVYVCSFHFVDKRPSGLHPDPELYLGNDLPPKKRRRRRRLTVRATQTADSSGANVYEDGPHYSVDSTSTVSDRTSVSSSARPPDVHGTQWEDPAQQDHDYCQTADGKDAQDKTTQPEEIGCFIVQNDADALLYTGIALVTFNILVSTLERYASSSFTMSVRDQVLMTLMKLKTNCAIGDLSRQFHVSQSTASKIISYWIDKLDEVLRPLIPWLPGETIRATMPAAFKENFPDTTCILDFSECLLQKPKHHDSRGESYSHYYNRVKYLVAVAPCGLIMFVSAAYEGRCSVKFITMDSGILDYLKPGDEVMADGGFTIKEVLFVRKVKFVMPFFTKENEQLTEEQATCKRRIARVKNHVERAIRRLKVYKILSQVVSITVAPKISKILRICAALVNLKAE